MPWATAASRASSTPSTVSWSLSANSSTPAAAAAATRSPTASSPSEWRECDCRSMRCTNATLARVAVRDEEALELGDEGVAMLREAVGAAQVACTTPRRERPGDQRAAAEQILIGGPGGDEAESEALTAVCQGGVVPARACWAGGGPGG